eukprot:1152679-Pelagomonas_calceolata.AAC.1
MYRDVALLEKEQFKYLSMLVDKHMNLKVSEEHAVRPYMAAQQMIKECVQEHGLRNWPHALLWLSKVYGIPAGCMRAKCGVQNIYKKAMSSKANCKKGTYAPRGVF